MCYRLEMARKHILNWSKTVRQWCKTINGKKVYFGTASAKSNRKDYLKAEARYRAYMAELDKNPDLDKTPRQVQPTHISHLQGSSRDPKLFCYIDSSLGMRCVA